MTVAMDTRVIRMDLEVWRRLGTFLAVNVSGTSLLFETVDWDVLGVPKADPRRKAFTPGRRPVVPAKWAREAKRREDRLRANADRYHVETGVPWLDYRWIPATAYPAWEAGHQAEAEAFYGVKQFLLRNWDVLSEETIDFYSQAAYDAWTGIVAIERRMGNLPDDQRTPDRGTFTHMVTQRASQALALRRDRIAERLHVRVVRAVLEDSADLAARIKRLEEDNLAVAGLRADQEVIRQMKQAELAQMERDLAVVGTPLRRMTDQMLAKIDAIARNVAQTITERGHLPGKTAEQARTIRDIYDLFAPQRHESLEAAIAAFEQVLGGGISKNEPTTVTAALSNLQHILTLTSEAAERVKTDIAQIDRTGMILNV